VKHAQPYLCVFVVLFFFYFADAQDKELLKAHNISHVLSIHDNASPVLETFQQVSNNNKKYFYFSVLFKM
uniref:Uncharacterized protein n=1 Tax=Periophthalmus magnuspinnatus TaxID=409849 RepID=A0A3B3ZBG6_9GOBI